MITRQQAVLIAKRCALRRAHEHPYLAMADDPGWFPHEWVIDAILVAGHLPRNMLPCNTRQLSDSMHCMVCGLCWDMNDPAPPPCPKGVTHGNG